MFNSNPSAPACSTVQENVQENVIVPDTKNVPPQDSTNNNLFPETTGDNTPKNKNDPEDNKTQKSQNDSEFLLHNPLVEPLLGGLGASV